jgi:hypothetical protein
MPEQHSFRWNPIGAGEDGHDWIECDDTILEGKEPMPRWLYNLLRAIDKEHFGDYA